MLTTIMTGCSSVKPTVSNNNQEQIKTANKANIDQSVKNINGKVFSSVLKNMDITKSLFEKGYYDYSGTINNNIKIQMSIYKQDKEIVGTYFYEKQRKEIKLKGKSDEKDIILYEYDAAGKNTGIFMGTMKTVDKIEGKWISA